MRKTFRDSLKSSAIVDTLLCRDKLIMIPWDGIGNNVTVSVSVVVPDHDSDSHLA